MQRTRQDLWADRTAQWLLGHYGPNLLGAVVGEPDARFYLDENLTEDLPPSSFDPHCGALTDEGRCRLAVLRRRVLRSLKRIEDEAAQRELERCA